MTNLERKTIIAHIHELQRQTNHHDWIVSYIKGRYQLSAVEARQIYLEWRENTNLPAL